MAEITKTSKERFKTVRAGWIPDSIEKDAVEIDLIHQPGVKTKHVIDCGRIVGTDKEEFFVALSEVLPTPNFPVSSLVFMTGN